MGAEIKKDRKLCEYYWKDKDVKGVAVTFCVAIGKGRCTHDPHNYTNCPNYIRYDKSVDELTPKTSTLPRFPS